MFGAISIPFQSWPFCRVRTDSYLIVCFLKSDHCIPVARATETNSMKYWFPQEWSRTIMTIKITWLLEHFAILKCKIFIDLICSRLYTGWSEIEIHEVYWGLMRWYWKESFTKFNWWLWKEPTWPWKEPCRLLFWYSWKEPTCMPWYSLLKNASHEKYVYVHKTGAKTMKMWFVGNVYMALQHV